MASNPSFETELPLEGYAEVLSDGDMEAAGVAAWTTTDTVAKYSSSPYEGTQYLGVSGATLPTAVAYQDVLQVGATFRVTGAARGDGAAAPAIIFGTNLVWLGTTSTSWQPFDVTDTCDGVPRFSVGAVLSAPGDEAFFDGLSCKRVVGPIAALADEWSLDGVVQSDSFSPFILDSGMLTVEDFENRWSSNEDRIAAFVGVGTDLTAGTFDSGTPEGVEDFEEEWSSNEDRLVEFGTIADGTFDSGTPEGVEDFEEEWSSNEDRLTAFVGIGSDLTAATFDVAGDAHEDFEEEWDSNEDRLTAFVGIGTDLSRATFLNTNSVSDQTAETFEVAQSMSVILGAASAGNPLDADPGHAVEVEIKGTFSASIDIEVQRDGFTGWTKYDTGITSPGITNLEPGITAVRIYTDTYASGTPQAYMMFRDVDAL